MFSISKNMWPYSFFTVCTHAESLHHWQTVPMNPPNLMDQAKRARFGSWRMVEMKMAKQKHDEEMMNINYNTNDFHAR